MQTHILHPVGDEHFLTLADPHNLNAALTAFILLQGESYPMIPIECPICRNADGGRCVEIPDNSPILRQFFECDICHRFGLTIEVARRLKSGDDSQGVAAMPRAILSHRMCIASPARPNELPRVVDAAYLKEIESHGRLPSPIEQANTLLRYIGDEVTRTGERLEELPQDVHALVGAVGRPAAMQRVEQLCNKGVVSCGTENRSALSRSGQYSEYGELDLTLDGWELYEQQKRGRTAGNYGFVALQFDNEALMAFLDAVGPMIEEALGLELRDMRGVAKAGVIDNIMREQIRGSAFVLADLTDDNRGAYREAGYAEGLGKPVIYICEKEKFSRAKTHFDTNHCTTVTWSADDPEGFVTELIATLRRSLDEREFTA